MKSLLLAITATLPLLFAGCSASNPGTTPGNPIQSPPSKSPSPKAVNEWTWVSGSNAVNQPGSYGALGTAATGNVPSARLGSIGWTDAAGNLWLFGGAGPSIGGSCGTLDPLCSSGTNQWYSDLWKFDGKDWTWVGGSNNTDQPGIYGTKGIAAPGNAPGARFSAVSWTDSSGNFWLFGGQGYDAQGNIGLLNDLWEYSAGQWTWIGGSSLIHQSGIYGTEGQVAPGNFPGARSQAVGRVDPSGNFLLFGGQGCDSTANCGGALSDVWKYSAGQWTWIAGTSVTFPTQPGIYGTQSMPSPANTPGGRYSAAGWADTSGNLWIFGGVGWGGSTQNVAELNDLWKFSNGQWTWVGGPSETYPAIDSPGTYGSLGIAAPGNIPGSRDSGMTWADGSGNLWFFGGEGFGSSFGTKGYFFNDLWKYNAGEWTWVGGSGSGTQPGVYGAIGIAAPANIPGSRINALTWTDAHGNLWMFGGVGLGSSTSSSGYLNDLWEYQP